MKIGLTLELPSETLFDHYGNGGLRIMNYEGILPLFFM
jgi:hypothetical protein